MRPLEPKERPKSSGTVAGARPAHSRNGWKAQVLQPLPEIVYPKGSRRGNTPLVGAGKLTRVQATLGNTSAGKKDGSMGLSSVPTPQSLTTHVELQQLKRPQSERAPRSRDADVSLYDGAHLIKPSLPKGRAGNVLKPVETIDTSEAHAFSLVEQVSKVVNSLGSEAPNVLLIASAIDALARLVPDKKPQYKLVRGLLCHLSYLIYFHEEASESAPCRVPFFIIVQKQKKEIARIEEFIDYLARVITHGTGVNINCTQDSVLYLSGAKALQDSVASTILVCAILTSEISILMWVVGFWKVLHVESRKKRRMKLDKVDSNYYDVCIMPFKCWQVYIVEEKCLAQKLTRHCFALEKQLLVVNVADLQEQQEDTQQELSMIKDSARRLEEQLSVCAAEREALQGRLDRARPEVVNSTLCSVLNVVFSFALDDACLKRVHARRYMISREFSALLTVEEDGLQTLAGLSTEHFLVRWINFHLMQCKQMAIKMLEAAQKARQEETMGRTMSGYNQRDLDTYTDRCKIVRGLRRLDNLSKDLKDGTIFSVLYGVVASAQQVSPKSLWPLDERDPEHRAQKLCTALRLLLPSAALQNAFQPSDITSGNGPILQIVLATLFLHRSRLPSSVPEEKVYDYLSSEPVQTVGAVSPGFPTQESKERALSKDGQESQEEDVHVPKSESRAAAKHDARADVSGESYMKQIGTAIERACSSFAYETLQDMKCLQREGETYSDMVCLPPGEILLRWVNIKLEHSRLVHYKSSQKVTSWSDCANVVVLVELMRNVAPDVMSLLPEGRMLQTYVPENPLADEGFLQKMTSVAARCTSFEILTEEALKESHIDIIAGFVACLFLCRPNLPVGPRSPLHDHVKHIELTVQRAATTNPSSSFVAKATGMDGRKTVLTNATADHGGFPELCTWLAKNRHFFREATFEIRQSNDLQLKVRNQLQTFMGELLSSRAQGTPCALDADNHVNDKHQHLMPVAVMRAIVVQETEEEDEDEVNDMIEALEELVRKHLMVLKEIFRHYSTSTLVIDEEEDTVAQHGANAHKANDRQKSNRRKTDAAPHRNSSATSRKSKFVIGSHDMRSQLVKGVVSTNVITLRGFARLALDCRFHRLGLTMTDIETIFMQVCAAEQMRELEEHTQASVDTRVRKNGLTISGLCESMMILAHRGVILGAENMVASFSELIDRHLWPYATRGSDTYFYALAYDPGVAPVLPKLENILRSVYTTYAAAGIKSTSDRKSVRHGNDKRRTTITVLTSNFDKLAETPNLRLQNLEEMFTDAKLMSGKVKKSEIFAMVMNITTKKDVDSGSDDSDDDSSLEEEPQPQPDCLVRNVSMNAGRKQGSKKAPSTAVPGRRRSSATFYSRHSSATNTGASGNLDVRNSAAPGSKAKGAAAMVASSSKTSMFRQTSNETRNPKRSTEASAGRHQSDGVHELGHTNADNKHVIRDEISFMEFIDVLVVIVLYKDPNPFVPFLKRFEDFIRGVFLQALRDHWLSTTESSAGLGRTLQLFLEDERSFNRHSILQAQLEMSRQASYKAKPEEGSAIGKLPSIAEPDEKHSGEGVSIQLSKDKSASPAASPARPSQNPRTTQRKTVVI